MSVRNAAIVALLIAVAPAFSIATNLKPAAMPASAQAKSSDGIAWYEGDVDAAFAYAKAHDKPLFLYWGAAWCPPCNQVNATIFKRQDFIERTSFFVPVHIDGDAPGAQKLGDRFKVRAYPTMILFKSDGKEITRLPGEVDADRYLKTLTIGLNANHPVKETLAAALAGKKLAADEWRLLAFYSWETDEQQLIGSKELLPTLQRLARVVPAGDTAKRLALSVLVAAANQKPEPASFDKAAANKQLLEVLANPRTARDNMDLLVNYPAEIVGLLAPQKSTSHAPLLLAFNKAMQVLDADKSLSKTDRLSALAAQVSLARIDTPQGALSTGLLQQVNARIAETDRATTDVYERQSVINTAGHILTDAGLLTESDTLLKAELQRSHSPYYFMLSLASNAKKRGDNAAAIGWYEQAYQASKGPATRLQWGAAYLNGLIDLAPQDETRIGNVARSVFEQVGQTPGAFYERNRAVLERVSSKLMDWNKTGQHEAVLRSVRAQLDDVCRKLPAADAQRTTCQGLLKPAKV